MLPRTSQIIIIIINIRPMATAFVVTQKRPNKQQRGPGGELNS